MRMTRTITLICVLALSGSAWLFAQTAQPANNRGQAPGTTERKPGPVTITTDDNGKEIVLPKNGRLLVRLPSNPSTGYTWVLNGDPSPLVLVATDYQRINEQPAVGASQMQQLRFKASGSGTASLQLAYRRPWEKDVAPAKTFSVAVRVE